MILAAESLRDLIDFAVLLSLPGVLVLAWLVGRLLGVRRSCARVRPDPFPIRRGASAVGPAGARC